MQLGDVSQIQMMIDSVSYPIKPIEDVKRPELVYQLLLPNEVKKGKCEIFMGRGLFFNNATQAESDSLRIRFDILPPEALGTLVFQLIPSEPGSYFLELSDKKSLVVAHIPFSETSTETVGNLLPGDYTARVVSDYNSNGLWDPADYIKGIQPERTWIQPGKITVRGNWELKLNWNF